MQATAPDGGPPCAGRAREDPGWRDRGAGARSENALNGRANSNPRGQHLATRGATPLHCAQSRLRDTAARHDLPARFACNPLPVGL